MKPFIFEISENNPAVIFAALHNLPYSLWLDSADRNHPDANYSFIAAHPIETIEAKNGLITVTNKDQQTTFTGDPFTILQDRLKAWSITNKTIPGLPPFQGGLAGFFGYDLARSIETLPETAEESRDMPDMALGMYDQVVAFDHQENKAWVITHAKNEHDAAHKRQYLMTLIESGRGFLKYDNPSINWTPQHSTEEYKTKITRVIDYIRAGDIFQTNLTQRFDAIIPGGFDSFSHYLDLRNVNPAPFAAYMNLGAIKISSASPERFLNLHNGRVETRPIKGTRPRLADQKADEKQIQELQNSEKDRAENIMIVDLLRNDLSKVCAPESVEVEELCVLETFAGVHHLVSTVTGKLHKGHDALDLIRACFPGGSITGAPKIRAMEIIEELEPTRRGPYCGSMGYIGFDGAMDSNILIRTLVYEGRTVSLQAGGGITADSSPDAEYQETLDKAARIFRSFQTTSERARDSG